MTTLKTTAKKILAGTLVTLAQWHMAFADTTMVSTGQLQLLTKAPLVIQRAQLKKFVAGSATVTLDYDVSAVNNARFITFDLDQKTPIGHQGKLRDLNASFNFFADFTAASNFYFLKGSDLRPAQRFDLQLSLGDETAAGAPYQQNSIQCVTFFTDTSSACVREGDCQKPYCVHEYVECDTYQDYERSVVAEFVGRARPYKVGEAVAIFNGTARRPDLIDALPNVRCAP